MDWNRMRPSSNVEDRRGQGLVRGGGIGIGTILVVLAISALTGQNPLALLSQVQQSQPPAQSAPANTDAGAAANDPGADFSRRVLGDTEDTWGQIFQQSGQTYRPPTLVLFSDQVQSACGFTGAAVGPFYCPGDQKLYLDLSFFREMSSKFGAPGDFAQAYVIAHEVGHHVQNLLGISEKVSAQQRRAGERQANQLSVRLELQADCFAGVWGHYAAKRGLINRSDVDEALRAANAIGDDTLQQRSRGYVVPDSFTHGSSAQRVQWFKTGLDSGDPDKCETFN